ncbi:ABC-type branched-subunit amino acid transport system substrate-binding protein [Janthinobacterium sp. CG_23.3]
MDAVAGPMLRQMKQLGMNLPFMGGDGICSEGMAALAGEAMANDLLICAEAGGVEDAGRKGIDDFNEAYKKKYGIEAQTYSPYAYDAVMTMVEAMQKAGSWQAEKYLPELAKIHRKGVTGDIAFDARGDMQQGTLTLYTYKQGKRQLLAVTK